MRMLDTGLAIFPAGLLVALFSTRIAPLVMRFGVTRLILDLFRTKFDPAIVARRRSASSRWSAGSSVLAVRIAVRDSDYSRTAGLTRV